MYGGISSETSGVKLAPIGEDLNAVLFGQAELFAQKPHLRWFKERSHRFQSQTKPTEHKVLST